MDVFKAIENSNGVIERNIINYNLTKDLGTLCQNTLKEFRDLIESLMIAIYNKHNNKNVRCNPDGVNISIRYISSKSNLQFIYRMHSQLQITTSHYTLDVDNSYRAIVYYYNDLLLLKKLIKENLNIDILRNIENFPIQEDTQTSEYYKKIYLKILQNKDQYVKSIDAGKGTRCYIQKIRTVRSESNIFYQLILTPVKSKISKFDRIIAFSLIRIPDYYAVEMEIIIDQIEMIGRKMPIKIITDWRVSIRPCELMNYAKIFSKKINMRRKDKEYRNIMNFLTTTGMNLTQIVESNIALYSNYRSIFVEDTDKIEFTKILDLSRELILNNSDGKNIIKYLLLKLNNQIIKRQYIHCQNDKLSNLQLEYGCIPFDQMPFATSLKNHNPRLNDLLICFSTTNREHELLARKILSEVETKGELFTKVNDDKFLEIKELSKIYNSSLYYRHQNRRLELYNKHIYIRGYVENIYQIYLTLNNLANKSVQFHKETVINWLRQEDLSDYSDDKKDIIQNMFNDSKVALIYGAAGTGKSTLIKLIANYFSENNKLLLANTNAAVENLRSKVNIANTSFNTIFRQLKNGSSECDILIIDECSTVSNQDILNILEHINFDLLVLVGDVYQIESIKFGNWFYIIKNFLKESTVHELTDLYRTENVELIHFWKHVREYSNDIIPIMLNYEFSSDLSETIFTKIENDEITLCLNYDGLYGINNINRLLQINNPNPPIEWGLYTFKVNDPILFNDTNKFAPVITNNMKGVIENIQVEDEKIIFDIAVEKVIKPLDLLNIDLDLVNVDIDKSIVRFSVFNSNLDDSDNDIDNNDSIPFQIAYAISIHKAQGLEYDSVKLVISNEIDDQISHNIFYTAITRAKKNLKIYWSSNSMNKIIDNFKENKYTKDINLLRNKFKFDHKGGI